MLILWRREARFLSLSVLGAVRTAESNPRWVFSTSKKYWSRITVALTNNARVQTSWWSPPEGEPHHARGRFKQQCHRAAPSSPRHLQVFTLSGPYFLGLCSGNFPRPLAAWTSLLFCMVRIGSSSPWINTIWRAKKEYVRIYIYIMPTAPTSPP